MIQRVFGKLFGQIRQKSTQQVEKKATQSQDMLFQINIMDHFKDSIKNASGKVKQTGFEQNAALKTMDDLHVLAPDNPSIAFIESLIVEGKVSPQTQQKAFERILSEGADLKRFRLQDFPVEAKQVHTIAKDIIRQTPLKQDQIEVASKALELMNVVLNNSDRSIRQAYQRAKQSPDPFSYVSELLKL
jgi:hypothetical protein